RKLTKVALNECINIHEDDSLKSFLREMKNHTKINGLWGVIDFYGIAYGHKHDDLKIVLHYADKSDLGEYLASNFTSITWKERLSIILDIAAGLYQIHDRGKHIYGSNNNDKPSFDESIPSFYQNMIHSCCDKEPSNRPNAQTLANEIIDWKLNKMRQFNDKKRLISYMSKEDEKTVEKLQNDIILDPENIENNDIYSKKKSGSMESNALVESYKKAIDGDLEAMKNIAICLLNGNDIEKDMNEAFKWCMKCFRKNILLTREELIPLVEYFSQDSPDLERKIRYGRMLECGLGVDKDLVNAYLIYKNAAESGHAHAQFITGKFCEKGLGRKEDLKEAFDWFIKAIKQNNSDALDYINKRYRASFMSHGKSITFQYTEFYNKESIVTSKSTKIILE
ncbi:20227_t:CDS:2, partial [Racocetra persica]